jgi:hypothetical protein
MELPVRAEAARRAIEVLRSISGIKPIDPK